MRRRLAKSGAIEELETRTLLSGNPPVVPAGQVFSLLSTTNAGVAVGTVVASDPDAGQSVTFQITGGNNGAFNMNTLTGEITVANKSLLNVLGAQTVLAVQATDNVAPFLSTSANVTVHLNRPPVLNDVSLAVASTTQSGETVGTVTASDFDAGQVLTYSITAGNDVGAFAINGTTGTISVLNKAEFDNLTFPVQLTVTVRDDDTPAGIDTAFVTITRNRPPVVDDQAFSLRSDAGLHSTVGTITSTDADSGQTRTYAIIAGNNGAFKIDDTGLLTVENTSLLNALTSQTVLTVRVTDNGNPVLSDTASITVNLNRLPNALNQTLIVSPTANLGDTLGTVVASDPDGGQTLSYFITQGNESGALAIDATGTITVANKSLFDQLTFPTQLTVDVRDNGTPQGNKTISVTLAVNHAPVVNDQAFTIPMVVANGTAIGTVAATDPDGQTLTYLITAGNESGALAIDGTGKITIADLAAFNALSFPKALTVQVSDSGSPVLTDTAVVTLTRNRAPVINNQTFGVVSNTAHDVSFGTIAATDPDGNGLTFSLVSGGNGAFKVELNGELRVDNQSVLNGLAAQTVLVVQVTDNGAPNLSSTAQITVTLNHQPIAFNQTFSVSPTANVGDVLGTVAASDIDGGQTLSYFITTGNESGALAIDATGKITVANKSLFDQLNLSNPLKVEVRDNGTPQGTKEIIVTFTVNHAPVVNDQALTVPTVVANGTAIGTVAAADPDGQQLSYLITAGNESGALAIDGTGKITVANLQAFNAFTFPKSLAVRVTDSGSPGLTDTAVVTLLSLNQSPVVNDQTLALLVKDPVDPTIGKIVATDPDVLQTLTYKLLSDGNGAFDVNAAGELVVKNQSLLFALGTQAVLTVQVTDNGGPNLSDTAQITVNLNHQPIAFDQKFSVPRTANTGDVLGTVVASDLDAGQTLSYFISSGNDTGALTINANGQISVANKALYDQLFAQSTQVRVLKVDVRDNGAKPGVKTIDVTLTLNRPPVIGAQAFDVLSTSSMGTAVGTVIASDPDLNQNLSFTLTSDYGGAFAIDGATGVLKVNTPSLLGILIPQVVLTVKISDSGNPSLTAMADVTVNINHPPEFLIPNQTFIVPTGAATGDIVGTAAATDIDVGQVLTYDITKGNETGAWAINAATGAIRIANKAIYDSIPLPVELMVRVRDNGKLPGSATTTIKLEGNHAPVVNDQEFAAPLTGTPGTTSELIGTVYATDVETPTALNYRILSGNDNGALKIEPATGAIKIANQALYEALTFPRSLVIQVTDAGTPNLFDTAVITLKRNSAPVIDDQEFVVPLNIAANTAFGKVVALDSDATAGGLRYLIVSGNVPSAFAINETNGDLTVTDTGALANVSFPVTLTVQVRDNGVPQGTDTATITLKGNHVPSLASTTLTIPPVGESTLGTLIATDADLGQTLTYEILPGRGSDTVSIGATSGKLTIAAGKEADFRNLVFPVKLQVKVTDSGTPEASTIAVVTLVRSATNASALIGFDAQTFTVPANLANSVVGTVFAFGKTSEEMPEPLTLRFALANPASDQLSFSIDPVSGVLSVISALATSKTVQITVSDVENPNTSVTRPVTINVVTTNNHLPTAQNLEVTIPENSGARTIVGKVVANPTDVGEKLTFTIMESSVPRAFTINSRSGEITVNDDSLLDYERNHVITLKVKVTDDGQASVTAAATNKPKPLSTYVTVTINLTNEPDNQFRFDLDSDPDNVNPPARTHQVGGDHTRLAPEATFHLGQSSSALGNGVVLTVSIQPPAVGTSKDRLGVVSDKPGPGNISVVGKSILYDKTVIGMFTGGKGKTPDLAITFNSSATDAAVQALLRRIGIKSGGPAGERQIQLKFTGLTGSPSQTQIVNVVK